MSAEKRPDRRPSRADHRSPEAQRYRKFYNDRRWKHPKHGVRARQLAAHPLCAMCEEAGRITAATICDHIDPETKNSEVTFFSGPFQSLCDEEPWRCHSSLKQQIEKRGHLNEVGADGQPTDPNHPWNR